MKNKNNFIIAKKSLGQNFLKNKGVLEKIAETGELSKTDIVLEAGPGEGALTEKLLQTGCKVVAVEKDHRLIDSLKEKFEKEIKNGQLTLIEGDILDFKPEHNLSGHQNDTLPLTNGREGNYKIIANIPYYITGLFMRKFLATPSLPDSVARSAKSGFRETNIQPSKIVVMVQKEIADRIVAKDGKESILSISVKVYGEPKIIMKVSRGSFQPPPNVDSAILEISNISKKFFTNNQISEEKFFKVLHAGFAHKRKMLLGNLKEYSNKNLEEIFTNCKIDLMARAEDLRLQNWEKLVIEL